MGLKVSGLDSCCLPKKLESSTVCEVGSGKTVQLHDVQHVQLWPLRGPVNWDLVDSCEKCSRA